MARITFQKAPEDIAVGDPILSSDLIKLADAYNQRIESGVGDFVWRLAWAASSVGRNFVVDAPDADWLFNFFHFDPRRNGLVSYPAGSANTSGGGNAYGNPFVGFVLGNDKMEVSRTTVSSSGNDHTFSSNAVAFANEAGRLGYVSTSAANNWLLAARQRGVYDPTNDELESPFRRFAESFNVADYAQSGNGFNETWGGYQPTPPLDDSDGAGGNCNADTTSPYWKFTIRFKKITAGAPSGLNAGTWSDPYVDFGNTCPEPDPPTIANQVTSDFGSLPYVLGVGESATAYTVYSWTGATTVKDTLLKTDYTFVQDGTGRLKHQKLEIAARTLSWIISDLRGSESQRSGESFNISEITFDSDRYFSKQNRLAPAYGEVSGANVIASYPEFRCATNTAATVFDNLAGGNTHTCHADFGAAGVYIRATNIVGTASIKMLVDDEEFAILSIGSDDVIQYFDDPIPAGVVKFELMGTATSFDQIDIEVAELLVEAGHWNQLGCLLRAGVAGASYAVDGQPELTDTVKIVSDAFFNDGIMITPAGGPRILEDNLEESGLWDGARRTLKSVFSALGDGEFYSVTHDGADTSIEFYRYYNDGPTSGKDIFEFILPADEVPSGEIMDGVKYVLLNRTGGAHAGGTVTYNGNVINSGTEFTGVHGVSEYTSVTANYKVYQAEGIIETAGKRGWTNEWVMIINSMLADSIGTNPSYQLNDYANAFPLVNRCAVASQFATSRQKYMFRDLFSSLYKPELPSGYIYDGTLQYGSPSDDFYSSCMVYPKPYKLKSVTHKQSTAGGPLDRVIVKLHGRLQSDPAAPGSYGWDPTAWNLTNLTNEAYRTDENALRERAAERLAGHGSDSKVGDVAYGFSNPTSGGKGARIPQFYFARLVPKPHEDSNDSFESTDTLFTADIWKQLELYLRVMCEGWLDPVSTANHDCEDTEIDFDYTFENLCLQAFGKPWLYPVPTSVNGDAPRAFGNYPSQAAWAECFTNLCKAVNLLTHARLILPFKIEYKQTNKLDLTELTSPDVMTSGCGSGSQEVLQLGYTPAESTTVELEADWTAIPSPAFTVQTVASISLNPDHCPVSDNHMLAVVKNEVLLRGAPDAAGQLNALHDDLKNHIDEGGVAILAKRTITTYSDTLTVVGATGPNTVTLGGTIYEISTTETIESEGCVLVYAAAQKIDPGVPPAGDFFRDGPSNNNESRRTILYQFSITPSPFLRFEVVE